MDQPGDSTTPPQPDGFPGRLRQAIRSYGSTSSLARAIARSEGAIRKWLRGQSEPNVSDLRSICQATNTSVEWLVMGSGPQKIPGGPGHGVRQLQLPDTEPGELPPIHYKLMDDVVHSVRRENPALLGDAVAAEKQSSVITTVYNMSRRTRVVDPEEVARVVGLTA